MLSEFEQIEHAFGAEKAADVRKTLHFMLRHQFVFAGDRGTTIADSCGYRVHRDPEAQWAGIVAADEDVPLPRMKLDETIVALVLAAHWQDEVNIGAVEDRATVVTTLNTLYDRYREMVQANGRTAVPTSRFHEILKECEQRSLVDIGDFDPEKRDYQVDIRPMIKLISGGDALVRIERYVRQEETRQLSKANGDEG